MATSDLPEPPRQRHWQTASVVVSGLALLLWAAAFVAGRPWIERFEMQWLDVLLRGRLEAGFTEPLEKRIRLVHVDDGDLLAAGTSSEYAASARAIQQISELGARTIVVDVLFLHGTASETQVVINAIDAVRDAGCRVVIPMTINPAAPGRSAAIRRGLTLDENGDYRYGVVNMRIDPDRLWRHYAMTWQHDGETYPSLALAAFAAGLPGGLPLQTGNHPGELQWLELTDDLTEVVERTVDSHPTLLNLRHSFFYTELDQEAGMGRRIWNLRQLNELHGSVGVSTNSGSGSPLFGATVFFGYGAGLDEKPTSMGAREPGLLLHATAFSDLLQGLQLKRAPRWMDVAIFVFVALIAWLVFRLPGLSPPIVGGLFGALLLMASSVPLVWGANLVVAAVSATSLWSLLCLVELVRRFHIESLQRTRLDATMGRYFSKGVLNQIQNHSLSTEPREATLTVCLTDIRDFTTLTEKLEAKDMFQTLSESFGFQTSAALAQDGSLQHFWGDQFIAYWGAPEPQDDAADRSLKAVCTFLSDLRAFGKIFKQRIGLPFRIGVGLHQGPGLVGNIGTEAYFDYNIFGEVVNIAARVESLTKRYGVTILATRDFVDALSKVPPYRVLDHVLVKGTRKTAVELIELRPDEPNPEKFARLVEAYTKALEIYLGGDFVAAATTFRAVYDEFTDPASALLAARCDDLAANPPADWQGVHAMTEK